MPKIQGSNSHVTDVILGSNTHTHTHTHTHTLSLSLSSFTHTHTHTHTLSLSSFTHTHTHTHTFSSFTPNTHTHSLFFYTHTHTLSLSSFTPNLSGLLFRIQDARKSVSLLYRYSLSASKWSFSDFLPLYSLATILKFNLTTNDKDGPQWSIIQMNMI